MPGNEMIVLTINLCVLASGVTNRHLPKLIVLGALAGLCLLCALAAAFAIPFWACVCLSPLACLVVLYMFGLLLARLFWPLQPLLGFDDFKRERIDLFLRMLRIRKEWASVDVLCIQECYGALFVSGGYPERLISGAHSLGFVHVAKPSSCPAFPAMLGMNSGLLILSKIPILWSHSLAFKSNLEGGNVNRGVLHAELKTGVHVFTCHISPGPQVAGSTSGIITSAIQAARNMQIQELCSFMESMASGTPVILAGDANMDMLFPTYQGPPMPSAYALRLLRMLEKQCRLKSAVVQVRGATADTALDNDALRQFRPTFGYTGEPDEGGPAETWLSTYGNGELRRICDDIICYRDLAIAEFHEDSMCVPEDLRPNPRLTHLSDHWALRAVFRI